MATKLAPRKTTTAPKAAPATKKAAAPEPAKGSNGLKLRALDPAKIREQFEANRPKSGGGAKTPYLKMNVGKNRFRVVLLTEEGFLKVRQHDQKVNGKPTRMLDFETLFNGNNEETKQRLIDAGKLTAKDIEMYQRYGDPFIVFARAYKDAGLPQLSKSPWPQTKYLFHVISRGDDGLYVYEAGAKFYEFLMAAIGGDGEEEAEYPDLFDPKSGYDIVATATGEGLQRRYTFAISKAPSEVDLPSGTEAVPDLFAIHDARFVNYEGKVRALFSAFGREAALLGITPDTFGCGHIVVPTPTSSAATTDEDDE